ncbi:MAG: histidine--tRNA ligase [Synergistales bacterium]|nr:histidine--tRNA ligase [Synergistales bacterium]MDY6401462.1 histidine--tRNA ligase [Synergistales bacterium]MDY6404096.1 histidine--tRNA ligase [Synergistales bacterium]MDY6409716.1 histidine--tRNA ligase [Synergistales bacterium]MDY6414105.1 histidine--tRNA ligase [Synergistales bacterium]
MAAISAPRGTRDILPAESWKWSYIINTASQTMRDFGFSEIHLPIFEHTELFSRGVGETTDIVEKEMYTFEDRGGRSITLRPEATAGVMRAAIENNLCVQGASAKLWNWGPMFRHERPQKGRYRQFYQIDAECLGIAGAGADVEIISLSIEIFRRLGLKNLEVVINSVGCEKCRPVYRQKLIEYFDSHKDELCETCLTRLERNPLRILDCKNPSCGRVADGAPDIYDSLCDECKEHFSEVRAGLERLGFTYTLNKRLVRGLDYYTKTAYEILSGALGAQNAVAGGGRYDNLSNAVGGAKIPGVGFACGLDRVMLVMEEQGCDFGEMPKTEVYVAALDDDARGAAQILTYELRKNKIASACDTAGKSFKAQMKIAGACKFACIIGADEIANNTVSIKDMRNSSQVNISMSDAVKYILGRD